jgi:outer membrane receptor protein involved in Fe transport
MKKTPIASAVSIALAHGTLMMSGLAVAQEEVTDEEATSDDSIEEIITTGSRIKKDIFSSSAPMDVIDIDEASLQGVANVGELLQNSTTAAGSPQVTAAITSQFVTAGGTGANTISLRGLGANRTLVLLNGRRAGPSGTRGEVSSFDFSVLPIATIERVEVLKDGASSIYGSDAVAGVINIITRREDGGTFDGFISAPSGAGGEQTRLSASWGRDFDRGGFRITADYNKQEELTEGDRDYFNCGNDYVFDPDTGERRDNIDPRTGNFKCGGKGGTHWGHVWLYDYSGTAPAFRTLAQYDYDGDLGQYIPSYEESAGITTPPGWFPTRYDRVSNGVSNAHHPFMDAGAVIPETETTTFYAEGDYQLSDNVEIYGEVLLNRRDTYVNGWRQYWNYMYGGDAYGVGSEVTAAQGWFGDVDLSPTPITDHFDQSVTVDYQRFLAGLRGEFANGWTWDATAAYSTSDGDYWGQKIYNDSIEDYNWTTGADSCVGQVTSVAGLPCVDVRWLNEDFLAGYPNQAERDFLFFEETGNTEYNQWSIDAFVTGELLELPAGPLSIATGFHYREDEIDDLPGPETVRGNVWGSTAAGNTVGDDKTQALFVEFDVPLVSDAPLMRDLTLNASARYTDVDSYGDDTTWKVGVNWQILDSVRIRANQGTSFRTPALFELYLANQSSFADQRGVDPCILWGDSLANGEITQTLADNCAADGIAPDFTGGTGSATVFTGGGIGVLSADTSESSTFGVIWQPEFADLSISIDYFDIEIDNEVAQFGTSRIVSGCYSSQTGPAFGGTEPLCTLFDRTGLQGGVDNIRDSYINIASQTNRGIDYALRYTSELGGWGNLRVDLQANKQLEDTLAVFTDDPDDLNKIIGDPEWVGNYTISLARGNFEMYYNGRYVGQASDQRFYSDDLSTIYGETVRQVLDVDSLLYHSLSAAYTYDELGLRFLVGVANLTDEAPPQMSNWGTDSGDQIGNAVFQSQYDLIGRRAFMNVTWDFD